MGIFCEINLSKPPDYVYLPGQNVSGVIKYSLSEPEEFQTILMSLKGNSFIKLREFPGTKYESTYESMQVFTDTDTIIQYEKRVVPVGSYEVNFSYNLPYDIPSSLTFCKKFDCYEVICFIRYYIRLKFEKSGFFVINKHFRKEIRVVTKIFSRLPREPVIYGESKKLIHLFSTKDSIIKIKATIINSALPYEGEIEVHYEVENDSHVLIKGITTKLVEVFTFKAEGYRKVDYEEDVPGTEAKMTPIKRKESQKTPLVIKAPPHKYSIEGTWIVKRHYLVRIIAELPIPHKNLVLDIPVQIGVFDEGVEDNGLQGINDEYPRDMPPSYWEAMGEIRNEYEGEEALDKK